MPVLYDKKGKVVTITVDRPEAFNSFDPETFEEFSKHLIRFRDEEDAWVGIVTGSGEKAFSAGADLKKLVPILRTYKMPDSIMRGLQIWKPLIAAVNGLALGGGLEVALACDLRIAAENATFGATEVKWAIFPGWGATQRLPRAIPYAKAAEMIFMGNIIDAQEAYRVGLVNKVVPHAQLMPAAREWAEKICENGPLGVRGAKEAMLRGANMSLEDGLRIEDALFRQVLTTEDAAEGPKAFAEKRKPVFKGK